MQGRASLKGKRKKMCITLHVFFYDYLINDFITSVLPEKTSKNNATSNEKARVCGKD